MCIYRETLDDRWRKEWAKRKLGESIKGMDSVDGWQLEKGTGKRMRWYWWMAVGRWPSLKCLAVIARPYVHILV